MLHNKGLWCGVGRLVSRILTEDAQAAWSRLIDDAELAASTLGSRSG